MWRLRGAADQLLLRATSHFDRSNRSPNMTRVEEFVDVTAVEVTGDHRLRLTFADGPAGDVDFIARRWSGVFEPLRDPNYFARVTVDRGAGTIAWPGGQDMAPEPLYAAARRESVRPAPAGR